MAGLFDDESWWVLLNSPSLTNLSEITFSTPTSYKLQDRRSVLGLKQRIEKTWEKEAEFSHQTQNSCRQRWSRPALLVRLHPLLGREGFDHTCAVLFDATQRQDFAYYWYKVGGSMAQPQNPWSLALYGWDQAKFRIKSSTMVGNNASSV